MSKKRITHTMEDVKNAEKELHKSGKPSVKLPDGVNIISKSHPNFEDVLIKIFKEASKK